MGTLPEQRSGTILVSTTTVNFPTGTASSLPIAVDDTPLAARLQVEFSAGTLTSYTVNPDDVVNPPPRVQLRLSLNRLGLPCRSRKADSNTGGRGE
jgi:hypothetical protein